jgi:hypothetical protein
VGFALGLGLALLAPLAVKAQPTAEERNAVHHGADILVSAIEAVVCGLRTETWYLHVGDGVSATMSSAAGSDEEKDRLTRLAIVEALRRRAVITPKFCRTLDPDEADKAQKLGESIYSR